MNWIVMALGFIMFAFGYWKARLGSNLRLPVLLVLVFGGLALLGYGAWNIPYPVTIIYPVEGEFIDPAVPLGSLGWRPRTDYPDHREFGSLVRDFEHLK